MVSPRRRIVLSSLLLPALWSLAPGIGRASGERLRVAVAANFRPVLTMLADAHRAATGDDLVVSVGSTGMLHAQVVAGAPFDVFLAADRDRPSRLDQDGRIVPGSRQTYALGRLALWGPGRQVDGAGALAASAPGRIAMADPALAPFGRAAEQTLDRLGVRAKVADRIVRGHSVGQAYQFVASGAAVLGLVATSQLAAAPASEWWSVPATLHEPIEQQLVVLRDSPAARRFVAFLDSPAARASIRAAGFSVPER